MTNKNLTRVIALLLAAAALACGLAACGKPEGDTSPAGSAYISSDAPSEPETSDIGDTSVSEPEISQPDISSDSSAPVDPGPDPADMERLFEDNCDLLTELYTNDSVALDKGHYPYRFYSSTLYEALINVAFPEYKGDPDYFENIIKPQILKHDPICFELRFERDQIPVLYYFIRQFKISKEQFIEVNESIKKMKMEDVDEKDLYDCYHVQNVKDLVFSDEEIKYLYWDTNDLGVIRSHLRGKATWIYRDKLYNWGEMVDMAHARETSLFDSTWEEMFMNPYREYYEKRMETPGLSDRLYYEYKSILTQMLYIRRVLDPLSD